MKKDDAKFFCALEVAIQQERYDELLEKYGDEWEVIERLMRILKEYLPE